MTRALLRSLALSATLVAIGLLTVGVSGVVNLATGVIAGRDFVAGDPPGIAYTPARCADFAEYHPEAHDCEQAATFHHFDELVERPIAVGVLGGPLLGAWWLLRRRSGGGAALPPVLVPAVGATAFGLAAAVLLGQALDRAVSGAGSGVGEFLGAGIASTLVGIGFGEASLRALIGPSGPRESAAPGAA